MINKIRVIPGTRASRILFFDQIDLTKLPDKRVVPLFGPNGIGKSTLISEILGEPHGSERGLEFDRDDTPMQMLSYQNSSDNFKDRQPRSYMESFDPFFINARFDAQSVSEGQSIIYSVFDLLDGLKPGKDSFALEGGELLVLLDEIDSGLSIDNIDTAMRKIKNALSKRNDIQIFLSFNSPRVLKFFPNVISMYDGSVLHLETEDDMMAVIKEHKKEFDRKRKTSKGRPKVFR